MRVTCYKFTINIQLSRKVEHTCFYKKSHWFKFRSGAKQHRMIVAH